MNILIPTIVGDRHALAVETVLSAQGHNVTRWFTPDMPTRQSLSLRFGKQPSNWRVRGTNIDTTGQTYDRVWLRRPRAAQLPTDIHPSDKQVADDEWKALMSGTWPIIAPEAKWVNPGKSLARSENKPYQLSLAQSVDLSLPETLISNDPDDIRAFIRENQSSSGTIIKPLQGHSWSDGDNTFTPYATTITEDQLPDDEYLRLAPAIYQRRMKRAYEARVTIMGHTAYAAKIDGNAYAADEVDWRGRGIDTTAFKACSVPGDVLEKTIALMEKLNIVFGSADFIVTPDGEWTFLEINPQGQFLWLEIADPSLPLLDRFCHFLLSGDPAFKAPTTAPTIRFQDIRSRPTFEAKIQKDYELHVENESRTILEENSSQPAA